MLNVFWKCGCPNFLFTSYLFSFFSLIVSFVFAFLLFHSIFFFPSFVSFINNHTHHGWEKEVNTCCDGYVLVFVYVDSTSVEHYCLHLFAMITKTPWTFMWAFQLLFYSCHLKLHIWVLHLHYFCLQVFLFLNALLCYMFGESSWKPYLHFFLCCFLKVKLCNLATRFLGVCFAYFYKNLSLETHI